MTKSCIEVIHEQIEPYAELTIRSLQKKSNAPTKMKSSAYYISEKSDTHLKIEGWFWGDEVNIENPLRRSGLTFCFFDSCRDITVDIPGPRISEHNICSIVCPEMEVVICTNFRNGYRIILRKIENDLYEFVAKDDRDNYTIRFALTADELRHIAKIIHDIGDNVISATL